MAASRKSMSVRGEAIKKMHGEKKRHGRKEAASILVLLKMGTMLLLKR